MSNWVSYISEWEAKTRQKQFVASDKSNIIFSNNTFRVLATVHYSKEIVLKVWKQRVYCADLH